MPCPRAQPGFEPGTYCSQVRGPDHSTTTPAQLTSLIKYVHCAAGLDKHFTQLPRASKNYSQANRFGVSSIESLMLAEPWCLA